LELEVEVVLLGLRPHLDFLDQDRRLLLARFLQPPGLRVLVLAEIHDAAHRRLRLGCDLDEVELLLPRGLERLLDGHDAELRPVGADDPNLPHPDSLVDTDLFRLTDRRAPRGESPQPAWMAGPGRPITSGLRLDRTHASRSRARGRARG